MSQQSSSLQQVCVLGSTGSIGINTLDVIARYPERYRAFALTAHSNYKDLFVQVERFKPEYVVLVDDRAAKELRSLVNTAGLNVEVLSGADSLISVASMDEIDVVMAAIVGAAGLEPNLAAARAGKRVLLANKESLVMSGQLFMQTVADSGSVLLPIDSEHNAIFQCLPSSYQCGETLGAEVRRVLLTASGGPFRNMSLDALAKVTPEQACAHPNWNMGRKISVDSASLMNKGLELIEACWLFSIEPDSVDVHVHPESIIHSMVEYVDGSVLAQMGNPDMRTPIAYGLAWPERIDAGVSSLDLFKVAQLNFERPDTSRFPCLNLAKDAFSTGGTACAVLNAANECAVEAFLKGNISFVAIPDIIARVMDLVPASSADDIAVVIEADRMARMAANNLLSSLA